ncbi:MAG: fumarylacetoacetate hydrolase family protein [Planctomycetes bacterium]|nr:fumarylacetoacetate hydrolase family protein [Planctomycetota bacterium]
MRLSTIRTEHGEEAAVLTWRGLVPIRAINAQWGTTVPIDVLGLLKAGLSNRLEMLAAEVPPHAVVDASTARFGPLYRKPRKIWGIGLNYREHADDLQAPFPEEPASFIKGDHTIIGPGEVIPLPEQSRRVTAEAEVGLIIGRPCWRVPEREALEYVAGICLILDQTAEDILQKNPRFLTRAKNFPGFFSFGPELITLDEVPDLLQLRVTTAKNGKEHRSNTPSNMAYPPAYLISFHSYVMPWYPGDILSTGTPGAVVIEDGDVAECWIEGFGVLQNPVRRED